MTGWSLKQNLFGFEDPVTPGEVLFFRLFELFIAGCVIDYAWTWGLYTRRISEVVLPLGIAQYLDVSVMFESNLALINAGLITGFVILGYLRVARPSYLVAFLLLHWQYAARFTLGEIPHSANVVGMVLLGLAIAMLAFRDATQRRRFTMGFSYFFVGLGYTLAAFCKLIATGLFWSDGRHLWMWAYEKSVDIFSRTGQLAFNGLQDLVLSDLTLATAFLTIGLMTELFAFTIWWRRFRLPVGLAIIGLHFGIYMIMNIMFIQTLIILILLTLPWAAWLDVVFQQTAAQRLLPPIQRRFSAVPNEATRFPQEQRSTVFLDK